MASALFLDDLGAGTATYSDELEAALRYYAGGNWRLAKNAFYGTQVMAKAANITAGTPAPTNETSEAWRGAKGKPPSAMTMAMIDAL